MSEQDILSELLHRLNVKKLNKIPFLLILSAGLIILFTGMYMVGPEETGVIIRLGKFAGQTGPGLHVKAPFFIDSVKKIPVHRQQKAEFGFRTEEAGVQTRYSSSDFSHESLMVTGDLNMVNVEWSVQYRISDAYKYLFKVRNVEDTFRDLNESVMREVVGDYDVDSVLTGGRQEIALLVKDKVQNLCDQYETGIRIDQVVLQDVSPPGPVKPAFSEVNEAQQEKEKLINQAMSEYNQVIPKARGEAQKIVQEAMGYAAERTNRAFGEAARFDSVFKEYTKAPEVTKQRMYLETIGKILSRVEKKFISDQNHSGVLPLLDVNRSLPEGASK